MNIDFSFLVRVAEIDLAKSTPRKRRLYPVVVVYSFGGFIQLTREKEERN